MMRLKTQLVVVAIDIPVLLAHNGYISELIVHGIGPIPRNILSLYLKRGLAFSSL